MHIETPANLKSFYLWDYTRTIYKANFQTFIFLSFVGRLPEIIYSMHLIFRLGFTLPNTVGNVMRILFLIWLLIPTIPIIILSDLTVRGEAPHSFQLAIKEGFSNFSRLFLTYLLLGFICILFFFVIAFIGSSLGSRSFVQILLLFGAIFLLVRLQFTAQFVILRDLSFFNAISESWQLVKGQWWATFGHTLVLKLPIGIFGIIFGLLANLFFPEVVEFQLLLTNLFTIFVLPVYFIYKTLLFIMLEARKNVTPVAPITPAPTQVPE